MKPASSSFGTMIKQLCEDIDSVELANAKILKLEPGNQFGTKFFLEREDTTRTT